MGTVMGNTHDASSWENFRKYSSKSLAEEKDLPRARSLILRIAKELELENQERRSYLQLVLEKQTKRAADELKLV